jgi:predicted transcriptional regulator
MKTKVCSKCSIEKSIDQFYKRKDTKDGYRLDCKECFSLKSDKYYQNNKKKINKRNKQYNNDHKNEIDIYQEKYQKEYYLKNKERILIRTKLYQKNNKEKVNKYVNQYNKDRKKWDVLFKFIAGIRRTLAMSLRKRGFSKSSHTYEILGISYEDCLNYLFENAKIHYPYFEKEDFLKKNFYHIDHIIPLCTAKNEEDVIRLSHYTNLQILTKEDNMTKNSKLDWTGK